MALHRPGGEDQCVGDLAVGLAPRDPGEVRQQREPRRLAGVAGEELELVLEGPVLAGVVELAAEELRPLVGGAGDEVGRGRRGL